MRGGARGGQFKPFQHPLTPGQGRVAAQGPQNEVGRALRQLLHDLRRVREIARPNQQMAVFRHQDVADDAEAQLPAEIVQRLGELEFEPAGIKDADAAIDVRGEVVCMILAVIMELSRHGGSLAGMAPGRIHQNQCMRHPRLAGLFPAPDQNL